MIDSNFFLVPADDFVPGLNVFNPNNTLSNVDDFVPGLYNPNLMNG